MKKYNIFLIAGEESGDLLAAPLMQALKKKYKDKIRFMGVGGTRMQKAGLKPLFPMEKLSVMGVMEVLRHLPELRALIEQTVASILTKKPDIVITIDSPDFNFRVAKKVKQQNPDILFIHYVAPTVWAWRSGRAKNLPVDHLLALFPFEPPYFENPPCHFVGHPVLEHKHQASTAKDHFLEQHNISPQSPILVLLPGSRRKEIDRLLPIFIKTVENLLKTFPNLAVVIPVLPHLKEQVLKNLQKASFSPVLIETETEKWSAFHAGTVALATSGSVALELAAAGLPSVIAYRFNVLTGLLAHLLIKTRYANLINIILDQLVIPEYIQENCRVGLLTKAIKTLLENPEKCQEQRSAYKKALKQLKPKNCNPSTRAAEIVGRYL